MYKKLSIIVALLLFPFLLHAKSSRYGERLCDNPLYTCVDIVEGDKWDTLWPDEAQRDKVKRLNRMNVRLRPGMKIAVPKNLESVTVLELSSLPKTRETGGEKLLYVDLNQLAWGAYDAGGNLVQWGPAAGGKAYCPDVGRGCRTRTGDYRIYSKQGAGCKSSKFPIPNGGAPMPYCMHYSGGYAVHGSYDVPGLNASHGCVRIYPADAKWLNQEFVGIGTKVEVVDYDDL